MNALRRAWRRHLRHRFPGLRRAFRRNEYRSYADLGEDKALLDLAARLAPGRRRYVDLGCNNPVDKSVTFLLYRAGWSGLVVDADERHRRVFRRVRPRDTFVCAMVDRAAGEREVRFDDELTTGDPARIPPGAETTRVETVAVNDLLRAHVRPGDVAVLKVDLEGMDERVLRAVDLDWLDAPIILVEQPVPDAAAVAASALARHLAKHGFAPVYVNRRNVMYARRDA